MNETAFVWKFINSSYRVKRIGNGVEICQDRYGDCSKGSKRSKGSRRSIPPVAGRLRRFIFFPIGVGIGIVSILSIPENIDRIIYGVRTQDFPMLMGELPGISVKTKSLSPSLWRLFKRIKRFKYFAGLESGSESESISFLFLPYPKILIASFMASDTKLFQCLWGNCQEFL